MTTDRPPWPAPAHLQRVLTWAIARFELRYHAREFLTWVYVAVFFFLTFGFTGSDAVELVRGRGAVPKTAPWTIAMAMAGVTAFGQVITTMIAATAVLRDVSARAQELFFTTRARPVAYLGGRFLGATAVMLLVYLAIPVGLIAGSWVARGGAGATLGFATWTGPWCWLVVPNVLLVSALFFAAGAAGGSFMAILLLGIALVAMWQSGIALVASPALGWTGALIDPFGNAAVLATTQGWDAVARSTQPVPLGGVLVANRLLWLAIAAGALTLVMLRYRMMVATGRERRARTAAGRSEPAGRRPGPVARARDARLVRWELRPPSAPVVMRAEAGLIRRATTRDRGFVALAVLGFLNAAVNAWAAARGRGAAAAVAPVVLEAVQFHSRLFFILIATIYAGELVWRDRDVRTASLSDALPVPTIAVVFGRLAGMLAAEAMLVVALAAAALVVQVTAGHAVPDVPLTAIWMFAIVFPLAVEITLLSLLVHAVVQHKVAGHVTLIAGWVIAVALANAGVGHPLLQFGSISLTVDAQGRLRDAAPHIAGTVLYALALAGLCAVGAAAFWTRGEPTAFLARVRCAGTRIRRGLWVPLTACAALAVAFGAMAVRTR